MKSPRRAPFSPFSAPLARLGILLCALVCAPAVLARDDADNPNRPDDLTPAERGIVYRDTHKSKPDEITLPAFPRASDLIPLRADGGDNEYNYYVDVNSLSLTSDNVLFYTIVIQSADGASNVLYEGIRCATDEVKSYAYGTRDGHFERMSDAQWVYYYNEGPLGYRTDLKETYACSKAGWAVDPDTVLERLVMFDPRRARLAPKQVEAGDGD